MSIVFLLWKFCLHSTGALYVLKDPDRKHLCNEECEVISNMFENSSVLMCFPSVQNDSIPSCLWCELLL